MLKSVKIKVIISIMLTLMASCTTLPLKVSATENGSENSSMFVDMDNVFNENNGKYDYIEKKIEEENENVTGLIDEDIEIILNNNGILDSDIEVFSDEELKELENNISENSDIFVSYYAVNDVEELSGVPVREDEMIELTPEQVNDYIAEKYYNEKTDLKDELNKEFKEITENSKSKTVIENVSNILGLTVNDACAETITHGGISDKQNTSMLKETLVINEIRGSNYMHVLFKFEWTEMPKYRKVDAISLSWEGARYDRFGKYSGETKVTHIWYENHLHYNNGKVSIEGRLNDNKLNYNSNEECVKVEEYHLRENFIFCSMELHDDYSYRQGSEIVDLEHEYEGLIIKLYLRKTEPDGVSFFPDYRHFKTKSKYKMFNLVQAIACIGDGSPFSAAYCLISGIKIMNISERSGPKEVNYSHQYK